MAAFVSKVQIIFNVSSKLTVVIQFCAEIPSMFEIDCPDCTYAF